MTTSNPRKPLTLLDTRSLRQERMAVVDAARECMRLAQLPKPLPLRDYGHYRDPAWRDEEGALRPHLSVDWYIAEAWNMAKEKISGARLLETLATEPWRQKALLGDHYDIWLVDEDVYDENDENGDASVVGMSRPSVGLVLSVRPFDEVGLPTYSLLKTAALHELGHLFGLPSLGRSDLTFEAGVHCSNTCVMRQADTRAERWLELTQDRLTHGPYCDACVAELQAHFHTDG